MKRAIFALAVAIGLLLIAQPIHAQFEPCSLSKIKVVSDATKTDVYHAAISFDFACAGAEKEQGQMTRFIYKVPLTDITNFEASDSLGSLKVLEGPEYATVSTGTKESTIGVIFRKGLLITDSNTTYRLNVDFDSASIVGIGENETAIKPGNLVRSPKVTIITTGITETTYPIEKIDYELDLPADSSVKQLPSGCSINAEKVFCTGLTQEEFNALEIKWVKTEGIGAGLVEKIRSIFSKYGPQTTSAIKTIADKITSLIKGKI